MYEDLLKQLEALRKRVEALEVQEKSIAAGSVTGTMLADSSVTSAKIVDGTIATADIADDAVTNAKADNMAQATIKGRASGAGTGDPTDLSAAQVATIVNSSLNHTLLTNVGGNTHSQIDTHIASTTGHGATGAVVGTTNTQTLDNKTLSKLMLSRSDLTIASDAITVTGCYHRVDTQGAAATDNLATINGAVSGQILILQSVASSRDVTVKNGTGNIFLSGSDFVLDNSRDFIVLICTGGELNEICRSNNGA